MDLNGPYHVEIGNTMRNDSAGTIVAAIATSRARAHIRFRLVFFLTWLILVGGLVLAIASTGRVDPEFILKYAPLFLGGVPLTIFVAVMSIVFAVGFAIFGALGRISTKAPVYAVATLYISLVRGTPLIVQLIFVYSALPQFGIVLPPIVAGVFALSFNYGAYMTEIFRAGIQAIPRGQLEAAGALGMTDSHTMRRIILPQAVRRMVPPFINEFATLMKLTTLGSVLAVNELLHESENLINTTYRPLEVYTAVAVMFGVMIYPFIWLSQQLEQRWKKNG